MREVQAIILTGVSGSGKSTAIKALEDVGYLCIDNLPVQLLQTVLTLSGQNQEVTKVAVVVDVRDRLFALDPDTVLGHIDAITDDVDIVFLDAQDEVLLRRFNETRRRHPLDGHMTVEGAIAEERKLLAALRAKATVIDTSRMNVHELKRRIHALAEAAGGAADKMRISVHSFGFKYGPPSEAHYVWDVRFVPNPYFDLELRPLNGRDAPIQAFLEEKPETDEFFERMWNLVDYVVPRNRAEGKSVLTLAVGCTGGRHRSVYFAERLAARLREEGYPVGIFHRDVGRG